MSYYKKYLKYKNKYLDLKRYGGAASIDGRDINGNLIVRDEAKSGENFLDRPHLVAIVSYDEESENVPGQYDKITEILFSDGNVYKIETFFYLSGFEDEKTAGKIIFKSGGNDLISFLKSVVRFETIEDLYKNPLGENIYLTKIYNINGKDKSKILFNKVIKENKYDFDTGYVSITGNMISLEGDKPSVGDEFNIVEKDSESASFNQRRIQKELMTIDEYLEKKMH